MGGRIDERAESLGVGRPQLLDLAVLEDLVDHRMDATELLEHCRVGREAGRGPAAAGQLELLEQQRRELLRRVDRELVTDGVVCLAPDARDLTRELVAKR